eukprot:7487551-Karenia_brevis.AAC.1
MPLSEYEELDKKFHSLVANAVPCSPSSLAEEFEREKTPEKCVQLMIGSDTDETPDLLQTRASPM